MKKPKKAPRKVEVVCPHCGNPQEESPLARSTFCRGCGKHYSIGASGATQSGAQPRKVSLIERLSALLPQPPPRTVHCFECGTPQRVTSSARSSNCPRCGAYIDLQDFKITGAFSRNIRTHGKLVIGPQGSYNSPRGNCGRAIVFGALSGRLVCATDIVFRGKSKISGEVQAEHVLIHRSAKVEFTRQIRTSEIEVVGRMSGDVVCDGVVRVRKNAMLKGNVVARALIAEKGAVVDGQVQIGRPELSPQPPVAEKPQEPTDSPLHLELPLDLPPQPDAQH